MQTQRHRRDPRKKPPDDGGRDWSDPRHTEEVGHHQKLEKCYGGMGQLLSQSLQKDSVLLAP